MATLTLRRAGKRPLSFGGERIACGDTHAESGPSNTRWWTVAVYRTDAGRYVLATEWHTRWQGEKPSAAAGAYDTLEAIADALEAHDPLGHLVGFPVSGGEKYAERQRHIENVLRQSWAAMIGDVLGVLGVEERL